MNTKTVSVKVNGKTFQVDLISRSDRDAQFEIGGKRYKVEIQPDSYAKPSSPVHLGTETIQSKEKELRAPLPGLIVAILAKVGDRVLSGQPIFRLEAMKMENSLLAQRSGTLVGINVLVGSEVENNQILAIIDD